MKVRIVKLKELENALHPNNIAEGFDRTYDVNKDYFEAQILQYCPQWRKTLVSRLCLLT